VTIGVGFACQDGIVLCSDTQMSNGSMKFYEDKIFPYYMNKNVDGKPCSVVMTYAGNPVLMKSFWDKFCDANKALAATPNPSDMRKLIEQILENMILVDAAGNPDLYLLCGITQTGFPPQLLKSQANNLYTVSEGVDFVGCGDTSVIRYLSKIFRLRFIEDISSAVKLGTYLIGQAKLYVDGCGGDTDVTLLHPDGKILDISAMPYVLDRELSELEVRLAWVLNVVRTPGAKEKDFEEASSEFLDKLVEFSRKDVFDSLG
jgi:hypothetical protein